MTDLYHPRVCCWCESEGGDLGRPLTDEESAAGFFATHAECRSKLDALFAGLASRGVFVDVEIRPSDPA